MDELAAAESLLPPDFERWFWTTRFAKFAIFGGIVLGSIVGAFVGLAEPVLAMLLQQAEGPVAADVVQFSVTCAVPALPLTAVAPAGDRLSMVSAFGLVSLPAWVFGPTQAVTGAVIA